MCLLSSTLKDTSYNLRNYLNFYDEILQVF